MAATNESFADVLLRLRQSAGLSLRQLQEVTGIDRGVISRLESGEVRKPSPSTLNRLATALGVNASELMTAAGYTATEAEALPAIRPYLRTKYGHLSEETQAELADLLERLDTEQEQRRTGGRKSK